MIKLENYEVMGWEHAIRGMRNPMNSWEKSDSVRYTDYDVNTLQYKSLLDIGPSDADLMKKLAKAGTDHRKFMRMIAVYVDVTAPLYFWKEFKTYRAGKRFGDDEPDIFAIPEDYLEYDIEMNSCSTMHKIADKEFTIDDFSHEHLDTEDIFSVYCGNSNSDDYYEDWYSAYSVIDLTICALNHYRKLFLKTKDKKYWWQMIQLLPTSYNQKRTIMLNYEVLANMYKSRKNHKLDEWRDFCKWIESLPYSELITGGNENDSI